MHSRPDLLDPHTLSQLGGVELIARQVVQGFIMGLHRSPHRGFSAEFAELRAYQPGDDLRHIDCPGRRFVAERRRRGSPGSPKPAVDGGALPETSTRYSFTAAILHLFR